MSNVIERAKVLLKDVTSGEWEVSKPGRDLFWLVKTDTPRYHKGPTLIGQYQYLEDAVFIAAAPELVRELVAEVERLELAYHEMFHP